MRMLNRYSANTKVYPLIFLLLYLSNCSLMGLEEEESTVTSAPTGSLSDIEGTWSLGCTSEKPYEQETAQIQGVDFVLETLVYGDSDSACSVARYSVKKHYTNLVPGTEQTLSNETMGYSLTSALKEFSVTPLNDNTTNTMNLNNYCGESSWQTNQTMNVAGKDCGNGANPILNSTVYDRYSFTTESLYLDGSQKTYQKQP